MIKYQQKVGEISVTIEFETMDQLLKYIDYE